MVTIQKLLSDRSRWIKGSAREKRNGKMAYCLTGACNHVYGDAPILRSFAVERLRDAIRAETGRHQDIVSFNDSPSTTFAHIQKVLKRAGV